MKRFMQLSLFFLLACSLGAQEQGEPYAVIKKNFTDAKAVYFSADQAACIPMLEAVVKQIDEQLALQEDKAEEAFEALKLDALTLIAISHYNMGSQDKATEYFEAIVTIKPWFQLDASMVSRKIINLYNSIRGKLTGKLTVSTSVPGAGVYIDDRYVADTPIKSAYLLKGEHALKIIKVNFTPIEKTIRVNKHLKLDETLERLYASVALQTVPPGIHVLVDDQPVGETVGANTQQGPVFLDISAPSETFIINELAPGSHVLTFSHPCYQTLTREIQLEAEDYSLEPVALDGAYGTINLLGELTQGTLYLDNQPIGPLTPSVPNVCRGKHLLKVVDDSRGTFVKEVSIDANKITNVKVAFKPTILWLGLFDESGSKTATEQVADFERMIFQLRHYNVFAYREDQAPIQELVRLVSRGEDAEGATRAMDPLREAYNMDLVMFGVLDPLSISRDFTVYFFHYSHARPSKATISLKQEESTYAFINRMNQEISFVQAWIGAGLIPDPNDPSLYYIIRVFNESPAEQAGLRLFDKLLDIDGQPVPSIDQYNELLAEQPVEAKLVFRIMRQGKQQNVPVFCGLLPRDIGYRREVNYNLLLANLLFRLRSEKRDYLKDIYYLNTGLCYMHFGLYRKAIQNGFSLIGNNRNLGIRNGSAELYSGICYYSLAENQRARESFLAASMQENGIFGDVPYYPIQEVAHFYLYLLGETH